MAQQHLQFDEDKKKTLSENQIVSNILREPVVIQKLVSQKKLDVNRVVSTVSLFAFLFNIKNLLDTVEIACEGSLVSARFFFIILCVFFSFCTEQCPYYFILFLFIYYFFRSPSWLNKLLYRTVSVLFYFIFIYLFIFCSPSWLNKLKSTRSSVNF